MTLHFKENRENIIVAHETAQILSPVKASKVSFTELLKNPSKSLPLLPSAILHFAASLIAPKPPPPSSTSVAYQLPIPGSEAAQNISADTLNTCADFVLVFRVPNPAAKTSKKLSPEGIQIEKLQWKANLESAWLALTEQLKNAGVAFEIRECPETESLIPGAKKEKKVVKEKIFFLFLMISNDRVQAELRKEMVEDWLNGVRLENPLERVEKTGTALDLSPADRIRLQYRILTSLPQDGGAGIDVDKNREVGVIGLFPLHDETFNADWIHDWSTQFWISNSDLTTVRNHYGEQIAYYFSFLKAYTENLLIPASFSLLSLIRPSLAFPSATDLYPIPVPPTMLIPLWTILFVEVFRRREMDLAVSWGSLHVSRSDKRAASFSPDFYVKDPLTGKKIGKSTTWKRVLKQSVVFPVVVTMAIGLGAAVTAVNILEVLVAEHYDGDYKKAAQLIPSIAYSISIGPLKSFCFALAKKLNKWENHESEKESEKQLARKEFIFNSLLSFASIFLATYIYVPFGHVLFPALAKNFPSILTRTSVSSLSRFKFSRIRSMVLSTMVVKQIKNTVAEVILPFVSANLRQDVQRVERMNEFIKVKKEAMETGRVEVLKLVVKDTSEEEFLKRVKREWEMPDFEVDKEYTEMAVQFGQISMFSNVWIWTPLSAFLNNFVELRSDAVKLAATCKRPIPARVESISPWLQHLRTFTYLSPIVLTSTYLLFNKHSPLPITLQSNSFISRNSQNIAIASIIGTLILSESVSRGARSVVSWISKQFPSWGEVTVKKQMSSVRQAILEEVEKKMKSSGDENGQEYVEVGQDTASGSGVSAGDESEGGLALLETSF
ncbi:hypothetical protein HK098_006346 [Nowakowskiella sp. JEL0407]|nr:hypothetical protein HK098_006346 [Nowakowskiella sp. JEL0407]